MSAVSQEDGSESSKEPDYVGILYALERTASFILNLKEIVITGSNMISLFLEGRITLLNQRNSPFDVDIHLGSGIPHPQPSPHSLCTLTCFKAMINPIVH